MILFRDPDAENSPMILDYEFIDDNIPSALGGNPDAEGSTEGALYFWEHYTSNQTHILNQYQGGYGVLTKAGGVPVYVPDLISGAGSASKIPGRYIPVGQGFFVGNIHSSNAKVKFENDQRVFQREAPGNSVFFRNDQNSIDTTNSDVDISRVRINFTSETDGRIRPLLLAFTSDNSATDNVDFGYEASNQYFQNNDAFFLIDDGYYVIQAVGEFNDDKMFPLGFYLSEPGGVKFNLEGLENFEEDIEVYIYDALLGTHTKLNETDFSLEMEADYYGDRFYVTFKNNKSLSTDDLDLNSDVYLAYLNQSDEIYIKMDNQIATKVEITSMLGRRLNSWDTNIDDYKSGNVYRISVKDIPPTGVYVLTVTTDAKTYSKKVIIK